MIEFWQTVCCVRSVGRWRCESRYRASKSRNAHARYWHILTSSSFSVSPIVDDFCVRHSRSFDEFWRVENSTCQKLRGQNCTCTCTCNCTCTCICICDCICDCTCTCTCICTCIRRFFFFFRRRVILKQQFTIEKGYYAPVYNTPYSEPDGLRVSIIANSSSTA
jgi:hypothetical protein